MDVSDDHSEKVTQHGLRVLTIHGEGRQGLSIISVIDELCSRISQSSKSEKSQVPSELFDIICGTGIGAFIATLLGRYHLDIPRCKQVYMDLSDYLEERNTSRRSHLKDIRQEDVQTFLQALVREEGWTDNMNFSIENMPAGRQHFVLASKHRHHGESTVDVFHGANVPKSALNASKPTRGKDAEVSTRTAQAVAYPMQAHAAEASHKEIVVTQHGQKLHEIVSVAVRYARTFCSPHEVAFVANIGPSRPSDQTTSPIAKLPDSPGKWVVQKTSPITSPIKSAVMKPIKATWKTMSAPEHHQQPRRAKSISVMQWPIQGLGFSFEQPKSPKTEIKHGGEAVADLAPSFDIGGRLFNFDTAIQGLSGSDSDMTDLKETRVDIRHMISFMHASGLFEEAMLQHQSG